MAVAKFALEKENYTKNQNPFIVIVPIYLLVTRLISSDLLLNISNPSFPKCI